MGNSTSKDGDNGSNQLTTYDLELLKIYWDSVKNKDDLGNKLKKILKLELKVNLI